MALERRNPIPPGYYWQDAFGADANKITIWLANNRSTVKVLATTAYHEPEGVWVSFQVIAPTNNMGFPGYPTILSGPLYDQSQTSTLPEAQAAARKDAELELKAIGSGITGSVKTVAIAAVAGAFLWMAIKRKG